MEEARDPVGTGTKVDGDDEVDVAPRLDASLRNEASHGWIAVVVLVEEMVMVRGMIGKHPNMKGSTFNVLRRPHGHSPG